MHHDNSAVVRRNGVDQNEKIMEMILNNVLGTKLTHKHLLAVAKVITTDTELISVAITLNMDNPCKECERAINNHPKDIKGAVLKVLQVWYDNIIDHDNAWKQLIGALHKEVPGALGEFYRTHGNRIWREESSIDYHTMPSSATYSTIIPT